MLQVIENLLILQDRDRKITVTRGELSSVEPQREVLRGKLAQAQTNLDAAKHRAKQIESDRKKLELEVESKKQQIEKYSLQQFQTKKNEEYRALSHEIDTCRGVIVKLEDQQLELMEQAEEAQKQANQAAQTSQELKAVLESQLKELTDRETSLAKYLKELESDRDKLAGAVEERARSRYERLFQHKGENVVVGIVHGFCGGCHMKLPIQVVVSCQGEEDLVTCPNCARILYYSRDVSQPVPA